MNVRNIESEIKVATEVARKISDDLYGYYMTLRGPSRGAMPEGSVCTVSFDQRIFHEKICERVMGWVCYTRPLTPEEVDDYELVPDESNPATYSQYFVVVKKLVRDDSGKKRIVIEPAQNPDGSRFTTAYRGVAQQLADKINDAALDTNSKDNLTRAAVKKIDR